MANTWFTKNFYTSDFLKSFGISRTKQAFNLIQLVLHIAWAIIVLIAIYVVMIGFWVWIVWAIFQGIKRLWQWAVSDRAAEKRAKKEEEDAVREQAVKEEQAAAAARLCNDALTECPNICSE